jgi:cell division protein ZapA (FtsZ GTPase activity inhibitor)
MNKVIIPVPFSRVRKLEFPDLFNGVVEIVGRYNPSAMHVEGTYNLLLGAMPQLSSLVVVTKKHPESKVIENLRVRRKNVLLAIVNQTKALVRANLPSQAQHVTLVAQFVDTYWSDINSYNNKTITERLKQMLITLSVTLEVKSAFDLLGLSAFTNELQDIQSQLHISTEARKKSKSSIPKMKTREVKSHLGDLLSDLLDAIELARKANPNLDYMPIVNEINVFLSSYQADIKGRATRSKNAAVATAPTALATAV